MKVATLTTISVHHLRCMGRVLRYNLVR
jgi:hypothetical protein